MSKAHYSGCSPFSSKGIPRKGSPYPEIIIAEKVQAQQRQKAMNEEQQAAVRLQAQQEAAARVEELVNQMKDTLSIPCPTIRELIRHLPSLTDREITIQLPVGTERLQIVVNNQNIITSVGFPMKKYLDVGDRIISINGEDMDDNAERLLQQSYIEGCEVRVATGDEREGQNGAGGVMRLAGFTPVTYTNLHLNGYLKHFKNVTVARNTTWWPTLPEPFRERFTWNDNRSPLSLQAALSLADTHIFNLNVAVGNDGGTFEEELLNYKQAREGMKVLRLESNNRSIAEMFSGKDFYGQPREGVVLVGVTSNLWNEEVRYILYYPRSAVFFPDWEGGLSAVGIGIREKAEKIIQDRQFAGDFFNMMASVYSKIHPELKNERRFDRNTRAIASFTWLYKL